MKRIINLPLCILLGFLIFYFVMFVYGESVNKHYAEFTSWLNKPTADELLLSNHKLMDELKKLKIENAKYLNEIESQKKIESSIAKDFEATNKGFENLKNRYISSEEKLRNVSLQNDERRNLIVELANETPEFERLYFLFGYGCLYGREIYSVRESRFLPSWGYCFYKRHGNSELIYYDDTVSITVAEDINLLDVSTPKNFVTSNETVFNSYIGDRNYHIKLVLNHDGKYSEKFRLDLSELIKTTKASTISLIDPVNNSGSYLMTINDWAKSFFLEKSYKEYWSKGICKDDTDNICVKLRLSYNAGSRDFKVSKSAEVTFIYHYSDLSKLVDKSIEFHRNFGGDKLQENPVSFDELVKLDQASSGWIIPK